MESLIVIMESYVVPWLASSGSRVLLILLGAIVTVRVLNIVVRKAVKSKIGKRVATMQMRRMETLLQTFHGTIRFIIWTLAFLTILPELGVNIAPLLAGVGIVGLAIGMGSRNLIADYLSGLFILTEDHYRIGEHVEIAGWKGIVQDVTLRRTVLKDDEGAMYFVPNGQVVKSINFTRGRTHSHPDSS